MTMESKEINREINKEIDKGEGSGGGGGSQAYIGTPVGVVLCVDALGSDAANTGKAGILNDIDALLWHGYSKDPIKVNVPEHMLRAMEDLFELINYPRATTTQRSFSQEAPIYSQGTPSSVERYLEDFELLDKRGKLATFIIRVQQRQNSNWQGRITWVEKGRTLRFVTIMEMVRLIETALKSCSE